MFVKFREGTIMSGKEDEFFKPLVKDPSDPSCRAEVSIPNYEKMAGYKGLSLVR